jgi:hypothetical protein
VLLKYENYVQCSLVNTATISVIPRMLYSYWNIFLAMEQTVDINRHDCNNNYRPIHKLSGLVLNGVI